MPSTAGTVITRAASHLNDPTQMMYTSAVLLPFLNMAIDELESELSVFDVSPMKKVSIVINVSAGSTFLPSMPTDFVEAISVLERPENAISQDYIEVTEKNEIDPNIRTADSVLIWTIRNTQIFINPPTSDRDVLINYIAGFTAAANTGTAIDIESSRSFLALLTASKAARDLGNSPSKAESFRTDIDRARDRLTRRLVNQSQELGVRRRPYTGRRRG